MKGAVFISYRRSGNANALAQIEQVLVDAFGASHVFLDKEAIRGGDEWARRITEALRTAPVVLVLYSADWRGAHPDGQSGARIDDPDDWVRKELVLAHRNGRPLLPLIIDNSLPPSAQDLPEELAFLAKAQFMTLDPRRPDAVVVALRRLIYGRRWWQRFFAQATWIALGISALVMAVSAAVDTSVIKNNFAHSAAALRERMGWQLTSERMAIIEVNDTEFRELFGARTPLDGEVLAITLEALRKASERGGHCAYNRPVAINLELAPSGNDADTRHTDKLVEAVGRLAKCRPVVMACPQQVMKHAQGIDEEVWMQALQRQAGEAATLVFGSTRIDPEGLRHSEQRSELALVAADIALLPDRPADSPKATPFRTSPCVCPTDRATSTACARAVDDWDEHAVAVRLNHSADLSLSTGLLNIDDVAARRVVMIGANFGAPHTPIKRRAASSERVAATSSSTVRQSHLLNGALDHAPTPFQPWMLLALMAYAWVVATATLYAGALLERNSDRLVQRTHGYGLALLVIASAFVLPLLVAARWPAWTWYAVPILFVGVLTVGRTVLASFELVLRGQPGWYSPKVLWEDFLTATHKGSAITRLVVLLIETAVLVFCWFVAITAST